MKRQLFFWLTINRERDGSYACRKFRRKTLTDMAVGPFGNWPVFCVRVGLIGLSDNEPGFIENHQRAARLQ